MAIKMLCQRLIAKSARVMMMVAVLVAMAALFVEVPAAMADTNDDAHLNAMAAHNIHSVSGPADLIQVGHEVCNALSPSVSPAMLENDVQRASLAGRFYTIFGSAHNPLTISQAGILVNDAIATYCPNSPGAVHWHAPSFPVS